MIRFLKVFLFASFFFFSGWIVHKQLIINTNEPRVDEDFAGKTIYPQPQRETVNTDSIRKVNFGIEEQSAISRNNSMVRAINEASKSVVFIGVTQIRVINNPFFEDPFFRQFFPPAVNEYRSMGSGVIFTDKGHIITNYHVVENASKIEVHLPDGKQFEGKLLGADLYTDLAIIKIEGNGLPAIKVATNDSLYIGEWAVAIGNPFGALIKDNRPTVTSGVISAYGREFTRQSGIKYTNMIQTDAAINPGNSGGALINCLGELIGINTFILSPNQQGSVGVGFAIPASRAMKTLREILKYGKIRSFYTGISIQNLTPHISGSLGLKSTKGVIINGVAKNSPGAKAGLKVGDVIIKANGSEIIDQLSITTVFNQLLPGDLVLLTIIREKKELVVSLFLEGVE